MMSWSQGSRYTEFPLYWVLPRQWKPDEFSLSPIRNKYPDVTIQPDARCIVGSGGGNTVSGLAAARAANVHSPRPGYYSASFS